MTRALPALLLSIVLTAGLAGCGGDGGDDSSVSAPTPTTSAATTPSPGAAGSATPPTCPITPTPAPPPSGISSDLSQKPEVPAQTSPPPQDVTVGDVVVGSGEEAKTGDQVAVKYVGAFYDTGKQFDSSWSRGAEERLPFGVCMNGVIPGFAIAPIGMKVGGRRVVTIPSDYGYGPQGTNGIPGGSTLVFVIDLVSVTPA